MIELVAVPRQEVYCWAALQFDQCFVVLRHKLENLWELLRQVFQGVDPADFIFASASSLLIV
jgi:hypothetical protein